MNRLSSNHLNRLLLDDRGVLGLIVFCIVWFVGSTFNTKAATVSWFAIAVLIAVLTRLYQRRSAVAARSPITHPKKTRSHNKILSVWKEVGKALLLVVCLGGSSILIFNWRFVERVNEASSILVLSVDTVGHCCVAMACILWSIRSKQGYVLLLIIGMIAVLMGIAGGGVSSTLTAQTAVGLASCIGFLLAAQIIISRTAKPHASVSQAFRSKDRAAEVLPLASTGLRDDPKDRFSFATTTWPFTLLVVSLILIVASATARVADSMLPQVQAEVFSQLKDRFEDSTSAKLFAGGRYVSGNRIGEVQTSLLNNPNALALRGYCNSAPGYLRGNVFDDYSAGRWYTQRRWIRPARPFNGRRSSFNEYRSRIVQRISIAKVQLHEDVHPLRSRFPLNVFDTTESQNLSGNFVLPNNLDDFLDQDIDVSGSRLVTSFAPIIGTIEIYGEPERGDQTFFPLNSVWIESKAQRIGVTPHRLVDRGLNNDQPWVVGVTAQTATEPLNARERGQMLWVDPQIRQVVNEVAQKVAGNATTAQSKASQIANYFQREYTYTLRTKASPDNVDPIAYFLETKHAAHCEFFASASALMLRTLDVPTRYVTGYVMDQLNDDEKYYVALNRDAHAWVEYYDESNQQWISLETTPGRTFQTLEDQAKLSTSVSSNENSVAQESVSTGWLRGFIGYFASLRVTDTLAVIFQFLQIPALVLLVGWLWWHAREDRGDETVQMQIAKRSKMDRKLRRWGWVRKATETLHQFAERLESAPADHPRFDELQSASDWYRQHATELYRGTAN